jgi:hypothetical protein
MPSSWNGSCDLQPIMAQPNSTSANSIVTRPNRLDIRVSPSTNIRRFGQRIAAYTFVD